MNQTLKTQQTGFALISALVVLAIVTGATVAMAVKQSNGIELVTNILRYNQVNNYSEGILLWAEGVLSDDANENTTDSPLDSWNLPLVDVEIEGGEIDAIIVDLQSKFNINNLGLGGAQGDLARERFRRLLALLNISNDFTDSLADWVDVDSETRFPSGAEDVYYLSLDDAYRTANQAMTSVSELLLVKGVKFDDYEKLLPHICTLPIGVGINLNTAHDQVLMALSAQMNLTAVETIKSLRLDTPFTDISQSESAIAPNDNNAVNSGTGAERISGNVTDLGQALLNNPNISAALKSEIISCNDAGGQEQIDNCIANAEERFALNQEQITEEVVNTGDDSVGSSQSTASFSDTNLQSQYQLDPSGLTEKSDYFLVQGTVEQYNNKTNFNYIVFRNTQSGRLEVISRSYNDLIIGYVASTQ